MITKITSWKHIDKGTKITSKTYQGYILFIVFIDIIIEEMFGITQDIAECHIKLKYLVICDLCIIESV